MRDDKLDATRYRWLRHGDNDELVLRNADGTPVPVMDPDHVAACFLLRNEALDAEIDRMMLSDRYELTDKGRELLG